MGVLANYSLVVLLLFISWTSSATAGPPFICDIEDDGIIHCNKSLSQDTNGKKSLEDLKYSDAKAIVMDSLDIVHLEAFPHVKAREISLKRNKISVIDNNAFQNVTYLAVLDLSHNLITSEVLKAGIFMGNYSADWYRPVYIKVLKLSHNALHTLHPDALRNLPLLEVLALDANPFKMIDLATIQALSHAPKLQVLDFSSTQLTTIAHDIFNILVHLETLNISSCALEEVPSGLSLSHSLKELVLDDNPIVEIRNFPAIETLEVLSIKMMPKLTKIYGESMSGLQKLKEFQCSYNHHLSYIALDTFYKRSGNGNPIVPMVKKVYLNNNNLSYLEEGLFAPQWERIEVIDIRNNPWECECDNQWMLSSIIGHINKTNPSLAESVRCQYPIEMRGKYMIDLYEKKYHMRCLDTYGNQPEKDVQVLIGILLGLVLAVPLAVVFVAYHRRYTRRNRDVATFGYSRTLTSETLHQYE